MRGVARKVSHETHGFAREMFLLLKKTSQGFMFCLRSRAETAIAAAPVGRTENSTASAGCRTQAEGSLGDFDADGAFAFAVEADTVSRKVWFSLLKKGRHAFQNLIFIDRASPQFQVDLDVLRNGSSLIENM